MDKELEKKIRQKNIKEMEPYEVEPEEKYKTHKPKRYYSKMCYFKAYDYLLQKSSEGIKNIIMVHGVVNSHIYGTRYGHAWCEILTGQDVPGDIIFDGVLQRFYSKNKYYKVMEAKPLIAYTAEEAAKQSLKHEYIGLWEEELTNIEIYGKEVVEEIKKNNRKLFFKRL